ncbi:Cation transport ATPase [Marinobacter sp. ELB17]|nr:Cation transport ATPase [Marinobacter sp. ELB17]
MIERFASWYTPMIIVLAIGAYVITKDIALALTLLVIGCPGALVISTPISVIAGIGRAARDGILIKGGEYLETAGRIKAVAFDKTGTLTEGHPEVMTVTPLSGIPALATITDEGSPRTRLLQWAALAESGSEHPLGVRSSAPCRRAMLAPGLRALTQRRAAASVPAGRVEKPRSVALIGLKPGWRSGLLLRLRRWRIFIHGVRPLRRSPSTV